MSKVYPSKIHTFIVADNVREEAGSKKVTIVGAMPGGDITIRGATIKFPINIPLAFLVAFKDGEGTFDAGLKIIDPNNAPMGKGFPLGTITKNTDQMMQLLVNLTTLPIVCAGPFKVQVTLDDRVYDEIFTIRVGTNGPVSTH